MTTLHHHILLLVVSTLSLSWPPRGVDCASGVADSYPVMVEDGENNFLILNDDEVASSQFLKDFAGASKEEVEELVDSSPQVQDMILDKIKVAVDKRKKNKGLIKKPARLEKPPEAVGKIVEPDQPDEQIIHIVHHHADKAVHVEEEEEEDEDDDGIDDKKVAKMRAKLKTKAAKVFKIGAKMKEKLMKFVRKKDKKKAKKGQNGGRFPRPHFRYKITTVNDE